MFRLALIAVLVATAVAGGCDNDCSGHGTCTQNGVCACWDNWGMGMGLDSGDCSQRICPFEFAWVDTPDKLGNHHRYAECSNRGICDRDSGECECFPGYEGKACARTTCPNDCSGHGRCKFIEDLPFQSTPQQFDDGSFFPQKAKTFGDAYKNWDASKTRGCQCDPEWGDVDCSKRMCQHGNDIMDQRNNLNNAQQLHVQHIQFVQDWHFTRTFALTFTSKLNETFTTIPIVMPASDTVQNMRNFFLDVEHALEALPNGVIDNVKVNGDMRISTWKDGAVRPWQEDTTDVDALYINITFQGKNVQGPQNLLTVKHIACADGCTPKLDGLDLRYDTMNVTEIYQADYNSYECGRRGKCDYNTGICECFSGYSGLSCGTITSLV
eukprot:GSChrysophyteH1.ASY1.ANO1.2565.1 assembled CDS